MNAQGQIRTPDGPHVPSDDMVVGVRPGDAVAFADWLNDLVVDPASRLPTHTEADDPVVQLALGTPPPSFWLQPHGDLVERWTTTGIDQPHSIEASAIVDHLTRNLDDAIRLLPRFLFIRSLAAAPFMGRRISDDLELLSKIARTLHVATKSLLHGAEIENDLTGQITLISELAHAHDLSRACDLAHGLTETVALDLSYVGSLRTGFDIASGLYDEYGDSIADAQLIHLADELLRHLERSLDLALKIQCDLDLARDLARDLALDLTHEPYLDLALKPDSPSVLDCVDSQTVAIIDTIGTRILGVALGRALSNTSIYVQRVKDSNLLRTTSARFTERIRQEVREEATTYVVSLETLANKAQAGSLFDASAMQAETAWGREITKRLERAVAPILSREQTLDSQSAGAIRLASLCLAAEIASDSGQPRSGRELREIAAAITLLEQRLCSGSPSTETIILALK